MKLSYKYILFVLSAFVTLVLSGQEIEINTNGVINEDIDTISYYGSSQTLFNPLLAKFRAMIVEGKQQINVIHIGDDYVANDVMTEEVRKNLQSFMPGLEASRGMISPSIKETSNSYKIKYSSGWSSNSITSNSDKANIGLFLSNIYTNHSNESIDINVNNKNSIKYDFNSFRVYHSELNTGDRLKIEDMNVAYQTIYNKEEGYTEFLLSDYVSSIRIVLNKQGKNDFYIYGFYFQNNDAGVVYNSLSLNHLRVKDLNNSSDLFSSQLQSLDMDLFVLSLGFSDVSEEINEQDFETDLINLITKIRKTKPNIPILLTTPVETWSQKRRINSNISQSIKVFSSVANKTNCAVFDLYSVMGGNNSAKKLQSKSLMQNDLIHLTTKGYQLAGDLLYNAFWKEIEKSSSIH